jgi:hypothetical protein
MSRDRLRAPVSRILDLLTMALVLALGVPIGLFGAELLLAGRPWGAAYLGLAAALLLGHHVLTTPEDVPKRVVQYAVGRAVRDPEED